MTKEEIQLFVANLRLGCEVYGYQINKQIMLYFSMSDWDNDKCFGYIQRDEEILYIQDSKFPISRRPSSLYIDTVLHTLEGWLNAL